MILAVSKTKHYCVKLFAAAFLVLQSCDNVKKADSVQATDDTTTYTYKKPELNEGAFNNRADDDAEKAGRQQLILMQIDSTYAAISLLDEVKTEMTGLSPEGLTKAERNKKSKAIFNINIIQNELIRALDASILANLKVRTNELEGITAELEKNVTHLQTVTEKLNKATQCIGRLTNILAIGLSKGWIKPFTPKNASATTIKASVN
jgi:hypothetical protein